ncbi:hypothetical protein BU26DRAFT_571015 [Trematosphaeria pertusa]|uniref:Uncharacterized protein n=1 Tax=Trematosphaeria pertusa TaxID=390896 RepID=A0A6A6HVY0_9PLEO|nr:uncharacterized protein BU26DRAFT_571015 [Trematosphaeria pertusa]KAF2242335.1 hypothetical protein BU26DRAFT_571015 [Trematosphaeria pertusa]
MSRTQKGSFSTLDGNVRALDAITRDVHRVYQTGDRAQQEHAAQILRRLQELDNDVAAISERVPRLPQDARTSDARYEEVLHRLGNLSTAHQPWLGVVPRIQELRDRIGECERRLLDAINRPEASRDCQPAGISSMRDRIRDLERHMGDLAVRRETLRDQDDDRPRPGDKSELTRLRNRVARLEAQRRHESGDAQSAEIRLLRKQIAQLSGPAGSDPADEIHTLSTQITSLERERAELEDYIRSQGNTHREDLDTLYNQVASLTADRTSLESTNRHLIKQMEEEGAEDDLPNGLLAQIRILESRVTHLHAQRDVLQNTAVGLDDRVEDRSAALVRTEKQLRDARHELLRLRSLAEPGKGEGKAATVISKEDEADALPDNAEQITTQIATLQDKLSHATLQRDTLLRTLTLQDTARAQDRTHIRALESRIQVLENQRSQLSARINELEAARRGLALSEEERHMVAEERRGMEELREQKTQLEGLVRQFVRQREGEDGVLAGEMEDMGTLVQDVGVGAGEETSIDDGGGGESGFNPWA